MENNQVTHCCWLRIKCKTLGLKLAAGYTDKHLKDFIETQSKEIGQFLSCELNYNEKEEDFHCFVNYSSPKFAKKAAEFFNKIDIDDLSLKAEYTMAAKYSEIKNKNTNSAEKLKSEHSPMASGIVFKKTDEKAGQKKIIERFGLFCLKLYFLNTNL